MASKQCAVQRCKATSVHFMEARVGEQTTDIGLCERHHQNYLDMMRPKPGEITISKEYPDRDLAPAIIEQRLSGRVPTTDEMDKTTPEERNKLVCACSNCLQYHKFDGKLEDQECPCGNTKWDIRTLCSQRTFNPLRKVPKR